MRSRDDDAGDAAELPDDLLAPDDDDGLEAQSDDAPGIHGEEHFGLTPPG